MSERFCVCGHAEVNHESGFGRCTAVVCPCEVLTLGIPPRREDAAGARPNHCPDCGADRSLPITGPLSNPVDCMTCGRNAVATQAAGERLDQLANLEWDWDSYGAPPIGKRAIDCARRLMAVLSHPPQIVPTSHGGVQLEWHREGVEVEITIPPEGGTEFYVDGER